MNDLGSNIKDIEKAESRLQVVFPSELKQAWMTYNVIELRGGWFVHPIFDKSNPRKTCSDIIYANTTGRWEYMDEDLLSIADNGTGNQLVLKLKDGRAENIVYKWHHETEELIHWTPGIDAIIQEAVKSKKQVEELREKYSKK